MSISILGGSNVDTSDATATANDIKAGATAYAKDTKLTGTLQEVEGGINANANTVKLNTIHPTDTPYITLSNGVQIPRNVLPSFENKTVLVRYYVSNNVEDMLQIIMVDNTYDLMASYYVNYDYNIRPGKEGTFASDSILSIYVYEGDDLSKITSVDDFALEENRFQATGFGNPARATYSTSNVKEGGKIIYPETTNDMKEVLTMSSEYTDEDKIIKNKSGIVENAESNKVAEAIALTPDKLAEGTKILGVEGTLASNPFPKTTGLTKEEMKAVTTTYNEVVPYEFTLDSSVTDLSFLFFENKGIVTIPNINTSNVTNMIGMVRDCSKLKKIPMLNTSKVTEAYDMFSGCGSLESVPLLDTSNATDIHGMFRGCISLTHVPPLNTSKATRCHAMFSGCESLESVPLLDTSKATDLTSMFENCRKLKTVPVLDTSSVTAMTFPFSGCYELSNESLNNIMQMCINAKAYTGTKTLEMIGLTEGQARTCKTLSNWQAFSDAGWWTGYN